jgi:hypothetical protein
VSRAEDCEGGDFGKDKRVHDARLDQETRAVAHPLHHPRLEHEREPDDRDHLRRRRVEVGPRHPLDCRSAVGWPTSPIRRPRQATRSGVASYSRAVTTRAAVARGVTVVVVLAMALIAATASSALVPPLYKNCTNLESLGPTLSSTYSWTRDRVTGTVISVDGGRVLGRPGV